MYTYCKLDDPGHLDFAHFQATTQVSGRASIFSAAQEMADENELSHGAVFGMAWNYSTSDPTAPLRGFALFQVHRPGCECCGQDLGGPGQVRKFNIADLDGASEDATNYAL